MNLGNGRWRWVESGSGEGGGVDAKVRGFRVSPGKVRGKSGPGQGFRGSKTSIF